jgi:hypothetical protein
LVLYFKGAGVGFVLGGVFLSMYVDIGTQTFLTPKSEEWVGAWWPGFIVSSGLAVLVSGWLIGFPKEFPGTEDLKKRHLIGNTNNVRNTNELLVVYPTMRACRMPEKETATHGHLLVRD